MLRSLCFIIRFPLSPVRSSNFQSKSLDCGRDKFFPKAAYIFFLALHCESRSNSAHSFEHQTRDLLNLGIWQHTYIYFVGQAKTQSSVCLELIKIKTQHVVEPRQQINSLFISEYHGSTWFTFKTTDNIVEFFKREAFTQTGGKLEAPLVAKLEIAKLL
jgi:hypothetical protein